MSIMNIFTQDLLCQYVLAWLSGRKGDNTRVIILDWAEQAFPLSDPIAWLNNGLVYKGAAKNALEGQWSDSGGFFQ